MTTQQSPKSNDSPKSNEQDKVFEYEVIQEDHPIKKLAVEFSKHMSETYEGAFNEIINTTYDPGDD